MRRSEESKESRSESESVESGDACVFRAADGGEVSTGWQRRSFCSMMAAELARR